MLVLALTMPSFISGHFLGFKIVFLERTLSWPHDLDWFWCNPLHRNLQATLLVNNLKFICINNMFLVGFKPNRSPLGQRLKLCLAGNVFAKGFL
jgi:hypothetical protein